MGWVILSFLAGIAVCFFGIYFGIVHVISGDADVMEKFIEFIYAVEHRTGTIKEIEKSIKQ